MTCYQCGFTAVNSYSDEFVDCDGEMLCPDCARDYRRDHPDMEEEIAKAEYREDR